MKKQEEPNYNKLIKYLNLDNKYIRLCGMTPEKSHMADCEDGCEKCYLYSKKHSSFYDSEQLNLIKLLSEDFGITIQYSSNCYGLIVNNLELLLFSSNKDFSEALAELALKLAKNNLISRRKLKKVFTEC